jgi:hypothetical protein
MLAYDHENKIDDPKDEAETDQTNDTGDDLTVHESGDCAQ